MPDWQNGEGASNHWRLSVVVEDNQGQRVSSNEITLTLVEPFDALSNDELRRTVIRKCAPDAPIPLLPRET